MKQERPSGDESDYKKTDEPVPDDADGEPSRTTTNKSDLDKPLDEDEDDENDRNDGSDSDVRFR